VSSDDDVDDSGVASLPLRRRAMVVSLEVQAVGKNTIFSMKMTMGINST